MTTITRILATFLTCSISIASATPLSGAISTFNKSALKDDIGKSQPPLTGAEVIAAIRLWEHPANSPVSQELAATFKNIATTKTLPPNAAFESLNSLDPGGAHIFDLWSVRIRINRPDLSSYAFPIRHRIIASRPLQEELTRLDNYIADQNVANWVGGHNIIRRRNSLAKRIEALKE
ncbi:MAG: hypothetical protein ACSHYF_16855 [Verrucomicrobiaceae bacterium]